jgi:hypothetical protein
MAESVLCLQVVVRGIVHLKTLRHPDSGGHVLSSPAAKNTDEYLIKKKRAYGT